MLRHIIKVQRKVLPEKDTRMTACGSLVARVLASGGLIPCRRVDWLGYLVGKGCRQKKSAGDDVV